MRSRWELYTGSAKGFCERTKYIEEFYNYMKQATREKQNARRNRAHGDAKMFDIE